MAYLYEVLQDSELEGIKELKIWSDGPPSQFKNKYIAYCLLIISSVYHCHCSWNYFATSHGKGPVDGIGGALKRAVHDMVNSRRIVVTDVHSFVQAYQISGGSIRLITCDQPSNCLLSTDDCPNAPGIRTSHHVEWVDGKLKLPIYSSSLPSNNDDSAGPSVEDTNICQGAFVVVHVHGEKASSEKNFIALITSTGDYITVMYLTRNGKKCVIDDRD